MKRLVPFVIAFTSLLTASCLFDKDGGSEHPYCEGGKQAVTVSYSYDRNDSLVRQTIVTIFGDTSYDSWYEYDGSGFKTKESWTMKNEGKSRLNGCYLNGWVLVGHRIRTTECDDTIADFSYTQLDSAGRVERIEYARAPWRAEHAMHFIYDADGHLVRIDIVEGTTRYTRAEFTIDSGGQWTSWRDFDTNGKVLGRHTYEMLRPDLEKTRTYDSLDVLRSWETTQLNPRGKAMYSIGCDAK